MKAVSFAAESGHIRCPERGIFMALLHKKSGTQQQVQQTVSQSSIWWEKCKGLNKEQKAAAEDFFLPCKYRI